MPVDTAILETRLASNQPIAPLNAEHRSDELRAIDAFWRAANYLSVGQLYLWDNPLLREPLIAAHIKPLVVGHWGPHLGRISFMST